MMLWWRWPSRLAFLQAAGGAADRRLPTCRFEVDVMLYVNAAVQPLYTATVRIAFAILYLLAVLNDFRDFCLCIVYYVLYNLLLLVVLSLLLLVASMLIHLLLFLIVLLRLVLFRVLSLLLILTITLRLPRRGRFENQI